MYDMNREKRSLDQLRFLYGDLLDSLVFHGIMNIERASLGNG